MINKFLVIIILTIIKFKLEITGKNKFFYHKF
jgi:hypothetical protein